MEGPALILKAIYEQTLTLLFSGSYFGGMAQAVPVVVNKGFVYLDRS
jgi:hypothetical protein